MAGLLRGGAQLCCLAPGRHTAGKPLGDGGNLAGAGNRRLSGLLGLLPGEMEGQLFGRLLLPRHGSGSRRSLAVLEQSARAGIGKCAPNPARHWEFHRRRFLLVCLGRGPFTFA